MAWTQSDLDAIEAAIATGARRVKFSDREVEYNEPAEMRKTRELIRKALGHVAPGSTRIYVKTSKGFGRG